MFEIIKAAILGVVEGVTEFLPVSSTGHLILAQHGLSFEDVNGVFTVVIQSAAIAAVIWFYRHDLWQKTLGLFRRETTALRFWKLLAIATIPAGIIGLLLESQSEKLMTPTVVAWALIIGGVVLWIADRPSKTTGKPTEPQLEKVTFRQGLLVGLGQCVALIPGVSRSGATIVSGLYVGLDRSTATAFSFYLSIPVLVLASIYKLAKNPDAIGQISGGPLALLVAMVFAFLTALASISWLLRYVSRHNFRPFAYYRIILGVVLLAIMN